MPKIQKIPITPLNACRQAEVFVRAAGFEHVIDSTKSEATYWRFPGRFGVLRVATHKNHGKHKNLPDGPVVACITFNVTAVAEDGFLRLTVNEIEWRSIGGIGSYMIKASPDKLGEQLGSEKSE